MATLLSAPFTPPDPTDPMGTASASQGYAEFNALKLYLISWISTQFDPTTGLFKTGYYIPGAAIPAFTGDATSTAGTTVLTVKKINGTALSGLATGVLVNTNGTGVPTIANSSTAFPGTAATATASTTQPATDNSTNVATTAYVSRVAKQGQFLGTATNDSATTGNIGEEIESLVAAGGALSLTTATPRQLAFVFLGAGDWDVEANINFSSTGATVTDTRGGISLTTAVIPNDGSEAYSGAIAATTIETATISRKRISLAAGASIYLNAQSTFSAGTVVVFGKLSARRVR